MMKMPRNAKEFEEREKKARIIIDALEFINIPDKIGYELKSLPGYMGHGLRADIPLKSNKDPELYCGVYLSREIDQENINTELENAPRESEGIEIRYFSIQSGDRIELE